MIKPLLSLILCASATLAFAQPALPPFAGAGSLTLPGLRTEATEAMSLPALEVFYLGQSPMWTEFSRTARTYNAAGQVATSTTTYAQGSTPTQAYVWNYLADGTIRSIKSATDSTMIHYLSGSNGEPSAVVEYYNYVTAANVRHLERKRQTYFFSFSPTGLLDSAVMLYRAYATGIGASHTSWTMKRYTFGYTPTGELNTYRLETRDSTTSVQPWRLVADLTGARRAYNLPLNDPYLIILLESGLADGDLTNRAALFTAGHGKLPAYSWTTYGDSGYYVSQVVNGNLIQQVKQKNAQGVLTEITNTQRSYDAHGYLLRDAYTEIPFHQPSPNYEDNYRNTYDASGNLTEVVRTNTSQGRNNYSRTVYSGFTVAANKPLLAGATLSAYPNPAKFFIILPTAKPGQAYILMDMQGRTLRSATLGADLRVETASLPVGLYQLCTASGSVRVVKE